MTNAAISCGDRPGERAVTAPDARLPGKRQPATLPEPLTPHLQLVDIFHALADPLRLLILRRLLEDGEQHGRPYHWFHFPHPKSTLSHHFKVLRLAGLLRQRQDGTERYSAVRVDDIASRFPGLLPLIQTWSADNRSRQDLPVSDVGNDLV